jgi:hypothetical protein
MRYPESRLSERSGFVIKDEKPGFSGNFRILVCPRGVDPPPLKSEDGRPGQYPGLVKHEQRSRTRQGQNHET